jgi:xanthine dehydrogenase YagT iron-sulfur-binding subunit
VAVEQGGGVTEVRLTVNGTEIGLDIEPRVTLAEALRTRLGLTGTHLGCEHGVCGACTVLVDGAAVRSCLLFAAQMEGAEVTTVEALGRPDRLHPLQEAFSRRHGLQCGFCTPGFLMSSYELLSDGLDPDDDSIAEALSGVICRCTGYRGIVEAVREVAEAYPDRLPEPGNLGAPLRVIGPRAPAAGAPAAAGPEAAGERRPEVDLSVPAGHPTAVVEVETAISAAPDAAWELLSDFPRASRCLPGVQLNEVLGPDTFGGHARLHMGPLRLAFDGAARVIERDDAARALRAVAAGSDGRGGGVRADLRFRAEPTASTGCVIRAEARLFLSGPAAKFGRALVSDVSRQLFEEFGRCVERTLAGGEAVQGTPLRGGALARRAALARS